MSKINGEKARFAVNRKKKLRRRITRRALPTPKKPAEPPAGS
ncbi:MAG TPA: hypothetical protein VFS34_13890 [Thermoanaerobaculia bacterium]|nr:hypothetical protein [Thermoanaerobaculia bacterium]